MEMCKWAAASVLGFAMTAGAAAEGFKVYPGATVYTPPDTEATETFTSNLRPGTTITAYLTNDSLEQVVSFYKGMAKEYKTPAMHPFKLPNGREIKKVFLIFDGARNPVASKEWISVQHPFIGPVARKGGAPQYSDIRDVTEIVLTEKKDLPRDREKPIEKQQ